MYRQQFVPPEKVAVGNGIDYWYKKYKKGDVVYRQQFVLHSWNGDQHKNGTSEGIQATLNAVEGLPSIMTIEMSNLLNGSNRTKQQKSRRYKAVLFDMGGVLIQYKDPTAYSRLLTKAREDKQVAQKLLNFDIGTQSVEELRDLLQELIPGLPDGSIEDAVVENHAYLDVHMHQLISNLRKAGLKVGIVTNNGFWTAAKLHSVIISDVSKFDLVLESCRIGIRKPDPSIYRIAAERLGVYPTECIFVDDTEGHCKSAKSVGMTAVHAAECNTAKAAKEIEQILDLEHTIPDQTAKENKMLSGNHRPDYTSGPDSRITTFVWESAHVSDV